jgi:hypothetical protein
MAYLPQNVQNLRQGLGINSDVEEGLVRKGTLTRQEIEEARKTKKEELDQVRYFADMEQANAAYVKSYREKYGAHPVPPSMSMATISMALLPSFTGIGTSTP